MKRIVLSAIVALIVTVGVYHFARVMGASDPAAFAAAAFAAADELKIRYFWAISATALMSVSIFSAFVLADVTGVLAAIGGIAALAMLAKIGKERALRSSNILANSNA